MSDNIKEKYDPFIAIRIGEFKMLLVARFLFIMGLRMMGTLVGWWVYQLTKDPLAIGLIGLSEVVPAISCALYAGHIIDKSEKKMMLFRGMCLYFLFALILYFFSTEYFAKHFDNKIVTRCIYVVIFFTGVVRAFTGPLFATMLASIVPKTHLPNAITWNQGTWLAASVSGHALSGFLIAYLGIHNTLIVILSLVFMAASIIFFKIKKIPSTLLEVKKKTLESMLEGLRFVFKTKELLGALSLDMFAVLLGGAVAMVPVYATEILHVGAEGYGILNAATDIGAALSVILLTLFPMKKQQGRKLLIAVAGFGVCIILFGLSKWFWLSFTALLISGMLDGISVVVRGVIMQLKTPDEMRGRVLSVSSMFVNSSNELGQFESGVMAKLMGNVASVVFGGCATVTVALITWFKAPSLRKMEY